jgi:GH25 family lysozyme M1 (1,4-beta-N-acetylmuramidase)
MRTFNERELRIIKDLSAYPDGKTLSLQDFLQTYYYTEAQGRALIIQNQGEYAILFLKPDAFANEEAKANEVKFFFELLALLNYLVKEGYLTLFREKTEKMYYIQDDFNAVKIVNNSTIVLNTKGYYTSVPDTIHDAQKNVMYKGIEFKGDQYQFILNYSIGSLIVSSELPGLTDPKKTVAPATTTHGAPSAQGKTKRSFIPFLNLVFTILLLLALCACGVYGYIRQKEFSERFNKMDARTQKVDDSLASALSSLAYLKQTPKSRPLDLGKDYGHFFGLDISKWNGNEISEMPLRDSITFIICKATEGEAYVDPDFSGNWDVIRGRKYILGAYHFYHTSQDPLKQAEHFLTTLHTKGQPDISPIVDIEQASLAKPVANTEQLQKDLLVFLKQVELKCKRIPIIYTGVAFADEFLRNEALSRYPLWLAEYTQATAPRIPYTWKQSGYKIWQKRDNYFVDSHTTDLDVFYGSKQDLIK